MEHLIPKDPEILLVDIIKLLINVNEVKKKKPC